MEVPATAPNPSLTARELLASWASILVGRIPMLSIEITRECPLSCPGCYAYGDTHLGGGVTLSELNDRRGDELVDGVLQLVRKHKPLHVSLVGGEPMVRHRELSKILPALSETGIFTLVVTSGIIPIPMEWMKLAARAWRFPWTACPSITTSAASPRPTSASSAISTAAKSTSTG